MKNNGDVVMGKVVRKAFAFESKSSPGVFHETLVYVDNSVSCNCKGWVFNKKCWHTEEVQRMLITPPKVERIRRTEEQVRVAVRNIERELTKTRQTKVETTIVLTRTRRIFELED